MENFEWENTEKYLRRVNMFERLQNFFDGIGDKINQIFENTKNNTKILGKLDEINAEIKGETEELGKKIEKELKNNLEESNRKIEDVKGTLNEIKDKLLAEAKEKEQSKYKAEMELIQKNNELNQEKLKTEGLEKEIENLKSNSDKISQEKADAEKRLKDKEAEVENLNETLKQSKDELETERKNVEVQIYKNNELSKENGELRNKIDEINRSLTFITEENDKTNLELKNRTDQLQRVTDVVNEYEEVFIQPYKDIMETIFNIQSLNEFITGNGFDVINKTNINNYKKIISWMGEKTSFVDEIYRAVRKYKTEQYKQDRNSDFLMSETEKSLYHQINNFYNEVLIVVEMPLQGSFNSREMTSIDEKSHRDYDGVSVPKTNTNKNALVNGKN